MTVGGQQRYRFSVMFYCRRYLILTNIIFYQISRKRRLLVLLQGLQTGCAHTDQPDQCSSYVSRALFSCRFCSSCNFCAYSRALISHTFFMMEASQPTTSVPRSLDILKLPQTPVHREEAHMTNY